MTWASRATRRQPFPTGRFSSAPTGTSTASRRTKLQQHEMAQQKRVDDFLLHEAQGRARHSVRAAGLDIRSERRARSDAPYYEGCQLKREICYYTVATWPDGRAGEVRVTTDLHRVV